MVIYARQARGDESEVADEEEAAMNPARLSALLEELRRLPHESEWVEWKHNNAAPEMIAETLCALANAAALHGRESGRMFWGLEDGTGKVVGTNSRPRAAKKGNEELENWLARVLIPSPRIRIHEWEHEGKPVALIEIGRARHVPLAFGGERFVRIGSLTKKLKDHPEQERELWAALDAQPFEKGLAATDCSGDDVLELLDYAACFELLRLKPPTERGAILARLSDENLIVRGPGERFDVTNLGAILFARELARFERLSRKALRIVKYIGAGRTQIEREWRDLPSRKGYAVSFAAAVDYIRSQLPQEEPVGPVFRRQVRMYPDPAIRELVANALIHQDFAVTGAGPTVEIFSDRVEIVNPGEPLVDPLRFIDLPPRSRNETLASMMRRLEICEELGTGIDKVVEAVETVRLPAPDFVAEAGTTRVTLFARHPLTELPSRDRVRACYQHACLCWTQRRQMTNATLRARFGIDGKESSKASRIIRETLLAGRIKPFDPEARGSKAGYIPFWA